MKPSTPQDPTLEAFLRGARKVAIVGIGNEDVPGDRLGVMAARSLGTLGLPRVRVFLAGTVPESITGTLRRFGPDRVLLLDAALDGRSPGCLDLLPRGALAERFPSTHGLSLGPLMEFLESDLGVPVALAAIRIDPVGIAESPDWSERGAVERTVEALSAALGSSAPA